MNVFEFRLLLIVSDYFVFSGAKVLQSELFSFVVTCTKHFIIGIIYGRGSDFSYICGLKRNKVMAVFLPSDTSTIRYEETDLASLHSRPSHFVCGVYLICIRGTAVVSTGVQQYALGEQTELIFLTGSLIQVLCASDDFTVRLLMFPKEVFLKAVLPIDTPYLNYTHEHPCYRHTEDERSQATWVQINLWMDMAQMLFCGNVSPFRQQQEYNFLQGLLMWLFNTIQEKLSVAKQYSRKQAICHRFMQLVRDHGAQEHQVAFYSEKLCITPRYLHQITVRYMGGRSPKQLIDEQLVAEIKVLLSEPDLSVTEIAERLHFTDQSCLTRFFKKHTGLSPRDSRLKNFAGGEREIFVRQTENRLA